MFNRKTNILKLLLFLIFFISFDLSVADDFDYNLLTQKINRLEQEISDIQRSLYSSDNNESIKEQKNKKKPISSKYQIRINKIENDFARMNGKFEEIFFRLDQLQEKLDTITSDIDFRLSNKNDLSQYKNKKEMEQDTYAYPKHTSDINTSGGDEEILGTITKQDPASEAFEVAKNFQTPDSLFDYGKDSLQNLNYSDAETAFRGFVNKYPEDKKIPSAYYWLGESLFVRENYPEAVLAYGEIIKNYKEHKRAPASLLKIGISFSNLDKKKESCDALKKILKQYPDSERDILKKTNYIIQKNSC